MKTTSVKLSEVSEVGSYDDLCDLQFVPYEASGLFFEALTDSAITVFCDNLFHGVITR